MRGLSLIGYALGERSFLLTVFGNRLLERGTRSGGAIWHRPKPHYLNEHSVTVSFRAAATVMLPAKLHTSPGSIWELHACTNGESGSDLFGSAGRKLPGKLQLKSYLTRSISSERHPEIQLFPIHLAIGRFLTHHLYSLVSAFSSSQLSAPPPFRFASVSCIQLQSSNPNGFLACQPERPRLARRMFSN